MSDRALQVCDLCGGVDDHPRHLDYRRVEAPSADVIRRALDAGADDRLVAVLTDTTTTVHHLDCGAQQIGCDTCTASEARTGGKRGTELVKTLDKLNSEGK